MEVAVTDEERQKGLMFGGRCQNLPGMLFDFKRDQEVSMWMHNTYVSLDMIFIQGDGRILWIAENTATESYRIILREARSVPCSKWWPVRRKSSA